ncbi:hypothetical protein ACFVHB_08295 [Kitasatospora sp. NPDC127111]|uniref:hypothetical protein n=1 Tax=Kitasatospora sp. NPDC127111 TaxID=3345363 RepID=UPI0036251936
MIGLLLLGLLVLVIGGCVCVVWADRGGPGWVRLVANATLGAGELVRRAEKNRRRRRRRSIGSGGDSGNGGGNGGGDGGGNGGGDGGQ